MPSMPHLIKNIIKKCFLGLWCLTVYLNAAAQNQIGPLGTWREHYNNKSVLHLVKVDLLYGATPNQVFSIDAKNNINFLGKSNGLHEIEITAIAWDQTEAQLMIAYKNSNIDIVKGDEIFSIADIYLSKVYANKKINSIQILGPWALVSTHFGIVVVDLIKHEIKDTWFANNTRQAIITYQTISTADSLYALTEEGLFSTALKNNYITSNQWKKINGYAGIKKLSTYNNIVYAIGSKNIYQLPKTDPIYQSGIDSIHNAYAHKEGLYIIQSNVTNGSLLNLNTNNTVTNILDKTFLAMPVDMAIDQNTIWIADSLNGLIVKNTETKKISLGGPSEKIRGAGFVNGDYLLAPFGEKIRGFSSYSDAGWKNYTKLNGINLPVLTAASIDPIDASWWFTAGATLLHYNISSNSIETISPSTLPGNYTQIQFSKDGIFWGLQDGQGLVQKQDNKWTSIPLPINYLKNGLKKMVVGRQGQAWIPGPANQGLYVYQSNKYFGTAIWKQLNTSKSSGNLPSNTVLSVALDNAGSIWVGTDNGIGIFNCGDISKDICDAYLPTIKNTNGFLGLLLQRESVNCIAVDGANRKWVGTQNGAWLLSADGSSIIEHFTKNNSPLPNDTILQILIEPRYGEVFFNTANEMVSYRGFATEGSATLSEIKIFPNPVPPTYNGPIAFRGLVENALVKITDMSGSLVFETRALGGQAIWNGKSLTGNKVATGIYLVFVRDDLGNEKSVGKIVITKGE
jgi:ligand-binding sensor domain-containing protein